MAVAAKQIRRTHLRGEDLRTLELPSPSSYADALGREYSGRKSDTERKALGIFFTPESVAEFMAGLVKVTGKKVRLLDPAAGVGILICAVVEALVKNSEVREIEIVAHEIDDALAEGLKLTLGVLEKFAATQNRLVTFEIKRGDFILSECISLEMLSSIEPREKFDLVIGNPPYLKIGKKDPRAAAASSVVHGQPNIYGLFMAVSAALLKNGGQFVFITPRSFASGPYFAKFRSWFFERIRPSLVHVFDSRRDAFGRDEVLQENVIFVGERDDLWKSEKADAVMTISVCHGASDLKRRREVIKPVAQMLAGADEILRIPASFEEENALSRVELWTGSLAEYGMKISTGPVVAFRAKELLRSEPGNTVPLLWLNHVFPMDVHWPNGVKKPQYIDAAAANRKLLLPNKNYVVMRRFSAKEDARRLMAAPLIADSIDAEMVGLENHLNYIYRPKGGLTKAEAWGLSSLFSSSLLDAYFRGVNGNTQVSATELRTMPLPPLEMLVRLGEMVQDRKISTEELDLIVESVLEENEQNN